MRLNSMLVELVELVELVDAVDHGSSRLTNTVHEPAV